MNRPNNMFRRAISLVLVLVLSLSVCPVGVHAQEVAKSAPLVIDGATYYLDFRFVGDTLYCPADQWAQATNCLWSFNPNQKSVNIYDKYKDGLAIFSRFGEQKYVEDGSVYWIPFFEAAKHRGVFFTAVKNSEIHGYQGKPLAIFYKELDEIFGTSNYPIYSLINSLGGAWFVASTAARSYAILSTMSIEGFIDAASGKMDQEVYDDIFIELLKTDESLLGAFTDLGKEISRPGKIISILQKSLDEDGALVLCLKEMGFSESEIREIVWDLAQDVYGDKMLNDWADCYEAVKTANLLNVLGMIDDMTTSIDADAHTIMAMQEVFSDSNSSHIRYAMEKAVGARMGSKALTLGMYTFEYVSEVLVDKSIKELEKAYEKKVDITNWSKLKAELFVWAYDKALSLSDKSDAIIYSEASSLIQLELADYYYEHCDDGKADTGLLMHSVALLYLRSCLASWKMFDFDKSLSGSIGTAKATLSAEITKLMEYTEAELLQNGTSDECARAITELVRRKLTNTEPEVATHEATEPTTVPVATVPVATEPSADNSHPQWTGYGSWSSWSDTAVTENDSTKVETRTVYKWYYYQCPSCGAHMHGHGITCPTWAGGCGKGKIASYHYVELWLTVSPDEADLKDFHGTGKYYAIIDGQQVFKHRDPESKTQYRYCTRKQETVHDWSGWSDWTTTPISGSSTLEVETYDEYQYTRYYMAHYCTGNVPGAQYLTWKSNDSSDTTFNANCVYHSLGWYDSLSSFKEGNGGYIGSTCSNSCWTWYIMDTEDVYITYYRSRPIS